MLFIRRIGILHTDEQFAGKIGALPAAAVLFIHNSAFEQRANTLCSVFGRPERRPFNPVATGALVAVEFTFITQQSAGR